MVQFQLNGLEKKFNGDPQTSLLTYLREIEGIVSVKDGCSGQAVCGACLLEVNGKPTLSCATPMKKMDGASIVTIEGFPESLRRTLGRAFAVKGAVQCGFCSPGFLSRAKILLDSNPNPTRKEIIQALRFNLCRCTGYVKIIEAIEMAAEHIRQKREIEVENPGRVGERQPKYDAYEKAIGNIFRQAGIEDRLFFPGFRQDIPAVLNEADILVHSAHHEPLGRVLLEAASSGQAIVATKVGGTPEIKLWVQNPGTATLAFAA